MAFKEILDTGTGGMGEAVRSVVAFATVGTVIMKSLVKVPKNHRGIPTVRENPERIRGRREGERYKAVGSGLHFVVPFIGGIESRSMQKQPDDLPSFNVKCKDGKFNVDASIRWYVKQSKWNKEQPAEPEQSRNPSRIKQIMPASYGAMDRVWSWYLTGEPRPRGTQRISEDDENLYRSLFEIEKDKLDNSIKALARAGIVAAARDLNSDELLTPNVTLPKIQELFGDQFDTCGVTVEYAMINSFAPSEAQVHVDGIRTIFRGDPPTGEPATENPAAQILHLIQGGNEAS